MTAAGQRNARIAFQRNAGGRSAMGVTLLLDSYRSQWICA